MGVELRSEEESDSLEARVNFIKAQDVELQDQLKRFWDTQSFGVSHNLKQPTSLEDRLALEILDSGTKLVDGQYQVPMLWKVEAANFPDNRPGAEERYKSLLKRFKKDHGFKDLYCKTVNAYIESGCASTLTAQEADRTTPRTWYLPHFGVTNPHKLGKLRIVFNAAATYAGSSLNGNLMSGPDLLNNLFGILQRFRLYEVTFSADIESMFHMVRVSDNDADALRFLWKRDPEKPGPPDTWRMNVHIFGAIDSPACANYALRRTGTDNSEDFDAEVIEAMANDFYMDDIHKSLLNTTTAKRFATQIIQLARRGGFRLHKCVSNKREVLEEIDRNEKAVQELDFDKAEAPIQRTLGVRWNVREDFFFFGCQAKGKATTKRGIVSMVSAIFDPCGYISPFTVRAKFLIQQLWASGLDWNEAIPEILERKWLNWLGELADLESFKLPRHHKYFTPQVSQPEIHMFCDDVKDQHDQVVTTFLASKTWVAPLKVLSIPRLELQGAVLAVRLGNLLQEELRLGPLKRIYWTDSMVVVQYLRNRSRRFKPFVANRIAEILNHSAADDWHYVTTDDNPADCCTRGLRAAALQPAHLWFQGPEFLQGKQLLFPNALVPELPEGNPELKLGKVMIMNVTAGTETSRAQGPVEPTFDVSTLIDPHNFSTWQGLLRRTAWLRRAALNFTAKKYWIQRRTEGSLSPEEYRTAALSWVGKAQTEAFVKETACLKKHQAVDSKSQLLPLMPVYDDKFGVIRVRGQLRKAAIPEEAKYQKILPRDHVITRLLASDTHWRIMHGGEEHLIAEL